MSAEPKGPSSPDKSSASSLGVVLQSLEILSADGFQKLDISTVLEACLQQVSIFVEAQVRIAAQLNRVPAW